MKPTITIESSRSSSGEYLLASVVNGRGVIGVCDTTRLFNTNRKTLYAGGEALVNVFSAGDDESANRQIWQCSSIDKAKNVLGTRLKNVVEEYFYEGSSLAKSIQPVLELLTDGIYVIHEGTAYPSDGSGNFFWNSYLVKHELSGSAPHNPVIGDGKEFEPAFLVPTQNFSSFTEKKALAALARTRKGRRIGGLAYHLSGVFSALLSGHENASACLMKGVDFPCIFIEPMTDVLYGYDELSDRERITALSSPFVKLPIKNISRSMLENFLLNRRVSVPEFYEAIRAKADGVVTLKGAVRSLPAALEQNLDKLPDSEMLASAFAISELPDEHLQLLLAGETKINDRYIISSNYYESIVYACNFLQYKDKRRFIEFTSSILTTPSLSATYRYVAERLRFEMDAKINEVFKSITESDDPVYLPIKELAQKYLVRYHEYMENSVNSFIGVEEVESVEVDVYDGADEEKAQEYSSLALKKRMAEAAPPPNANQ